MMTSGPILVASHDAGGAEVLSAYIKKNQEKYDFVIFVSGPAEQIFRRKNINFHVVSIDLNDIYLLCGKYRSVQYLLASTGWSQFEALFLSCARKLKIKTIAYLDHWVNYKERFGYPNLDWHNNVPDEIWVGDQYALTIARQNFPGYPIKLEPNCYFDEVHKAYKEIAISRNDQSILILAQPISEVQKKFTNNVTICEFTILSQLLNFFVCHAKDDQLILRLHPSENREKYVRIIENYRHKIKISTNNLLEDIASSKIVIGINTMALITASICEKKAINFLPFEQQENLLPMKNIHLVRSLAELEAII